MTSDKDEKNRKRIPIRFVDGDRERDSFVNSELAAMETIDPDNDPQDNDPQDDDSQAEDAVSDNQHFMASAKSDDMVGGPAIAELVATRSELKRVQAENVELKDRLARRQAEFENYRKRVDRERAETYNRVVADIAAKLLPVLDNLKRALDTEASLEATESDEFRHFLSGVDLIYKQLNGVLEALGLKAIPAVGEHFNPHIHEAVETETTDEYEPDTVTQELVAGYRLGDKLIRPALVKVARRS